VGVGIIISRGGYVRMSVDPDDSDVFVEAMKIIEGSDRD